MAFTETQKDQIRQYLGFSAGFYYGHHRLEGMLDKVGSNAVEQTSVEAILTELSTIATAIASAGSTSSTTGPLKAITGDVEWYEPGSGGSSTLTSVQYGRVLINRLAARFGFSRMELPSDYFGSGGAGGEMALG